MPFTVSHTIAAVPLRRLLGRRAVASALVIGAMVPDFRHLVPGLEALGTHTLGALLWFSLPVGMATFLFFHAALREPGLALLSVATRRRLGVFIRPTPRMPPSLAAVALCVSVGAVSHLVWDQFTHRETLVVESFRPFFYFTVFRLGRDHVYLHEVLQAGSSIVGLVALVAWGRRWLAAQPIDETIGPGASATERAVGLTLVVVAPATALVVRFALATHARLPWRDVAVHSVWMSCRIFALGTAVFALVWRLRHRRGVA